MAKIENIKREDNVISADCYAEGKEQKHMYIMQ